MSKLPVCNMKGERLGEFDLADDLLVYDKGHQALKEAIVAYRAAQRSGTASTLTKAEVAGTGAKPWKQKGSGRARAGYRRSPIWRGGGVTFGPKPRSYRKKMTRKMARLAFRRGLSEKVAAGEVTIIDEIQLPEPRTQLLVEALKKLEVGKSTILVVDALDRNLALAARNIPLVEVATASNLNVYQVLRFSRMLVTKAAMTVLEGRLKGEKESAS